MTANTAEHPDALSYGRIVRTMKRIPLEAPCPPGKTILVNLMENPRGTYFQVYDPDRGAVGAHATFAPAVEAAERRARERESEARHFEVARRFEATHARLRTMSQDEIVAEGRAHDRYGGKWQALKNPLVIRRHEWDRIHLGTVGKDFSIKSRRIWRWFDEQNVKVTIHCLPLVLVSVTPKHHTRFQVVVLDFDSAQAAFYFKMTWL
jgi:hypothetical protein